MNLAGVLFIILLLLKVTGTITLSWWLVTLPLWIGLAIAAAYWVLFFVIGLIALAIGCLRD